MTVDTILEKIHRKFAKDTDYPEAGSEDFLVRLDYINDAITEWENKIKEGVYWEELKDSATVSCGGTGTDALPTDFLSFIRKNNADDDFSALVIGNEYWLEVSMAQGIRSMQEGISPHIFWREGTNLRSLPAMSGSLALLHQESDPIRDRRRNGRAGDERSNLHRGLCLEQALSR